MKQLLITLIAFTTLSAFSQTTVEECSEFGVNLGAFRYHRHANMEGKCYMSSTPIKVSPDYVYRSFLMTNTGSVMVFNSIDYDQYGVSDGARMFTFFPRNQTPTIEEHENFVTVKSSTAGFSINLDKELKKIHSVVGADFKEDPKVYPGNAGGVEFSNVKFLYLDAGYMNYGDPTGEPGRDSKFIDSKGKTCKIKNREVFRYDGDGDPFLKFSDSELKAWLKTRCPQLTVNY